MCFLVVASIAVPTTVHSAIALYKVRKAGKLDWGAPTMCVLFTMFSSFFGLAYVFDVWVRKSTVCAQSDLDGGTSSRLYDYFVSSWLSLFGSLMVLAMVNILLMW
jgi:hypothetical protein